jgi:AraC-like DNA-binding protein
MRSYKFAILLAPEILKKDVECFRIAKYTGEEGLAISVSLSGLPGIVFQHQDGRSPVESIVTPSRSNLSIPSLYVYGQTIEPGVLNHKKGPYSMIQVILKPQALHTLLGINASALTNGMAELNEFSAEHLNEQLFEAHSDKERITLLTDFLMSNLKQEKTRDGLVEESLRLIHKNIGSISIRQLLAHLHISERQFEKRFRQVVGIPPQFYIRVRRFNEAIRLMKTRRFLRLTEIAYALNFHDQSHFIRDIKAFSGTTPKSLSQKEDVFEPGQAVHSYVLT